jgi:hypothetical protein
MKLLELICQGIGSVDAKKFVFRNDYNPIEPQKHGFTVEILDEIISAALHPSHRLEKDIVDPAAGDPERKVRIGITFNHSDIVYRYVRDMIKNAHSLSKFDKSKNDFAEISRDAIFVEKIFSDTFKIPALPAYRLLYEINGPVVLEMMKKWPGDDGKKNREYFDTFEEENELKIKAKRLQGLEKERKMIEAMKALEFDLDGLQSKMFETTDRINKVKSKEEETKAALLELAEYKNLEALKDFPIDIEKRLAGFEKLEEKKMFDLQALDRRLESLVNRLALTKVKPILKDRLFMAGTIIALSALVAVIISPAHKFLFFGLFSFFLLLSSQRLINFYRKSDESVKLTDEIKKLTEEKGVIDKKFDIETSIVRKFLAKIGASGPDDALDMIKRHRELRVRVDTEQKAVDDLKKSLTYDEMLRQKDTLAKEISAKEEKLRSMPSASMDPNDLLKAIGDLREELGNSNFLFEDSAEFDTGTPGSDPYSKALSLVSKMLNITSGKLLEALKKSFPVNLKIITGGAFDGVKWNSSGFDSLSSSAARTDRDLRTLNTDEKFGVFFALQFTVLQLLFKSIPIPAIVAGEFTGKNRLASKETCLQAIGHLSKLGQIIHLF